MRGGGLDMDSSLSVSQSVSLSVSLSVPHVLPCVLIVSPNLALSSIGRLKTSYTCEKWKSGRSQIVPPAVNPYPVSVWAHWFCKGFAKLHKQCCSLSFLTFECVIFCPGQNAGLFDGFWNGADAQEPLVNKWFLHFWRCGGSVIIRWLRWRKRCVFKAFEK